MNCCEGSSVNDSLIQFCTPSVGALVMQSRVLHTLHGCSEQELVWVN